MTSMRFRADYDDEPKLRYSSLTYKPDIFRTGIADYLNQLGHEAIEHLVFIVHPGELLESNRSEVASGLYSFDVEELKINLEVTLEMVDHLGGTVEFMPVCEIRNRINL